jgi:hypothetical protein
MDRRIPNKLYLCLSRGFGVLGDCRISLKKHNHWLGALTFARDVCRGDSRIPGTHLRHGANQHFPLVDTLQSRDDLDGILSSFGGIRAFEI